MTVETALNNKTELNHEQVAGRWLKPMMGEQVLQVTIPGVGGMNGHLVVAGPLKGLMKTRYIQVFSEDDRGKGYGRRLLRSFAAEAKLAGATTLAGNVISAQEIHNRVQTFGEGNVRFYEAPPYAEGQDGSAVEVPLTREQAIQSLDRAHEVNNCLTITTMTDLAAIDTSSWELPVIENVSRRPNLDEQPEILSEVLGRLSLGNPQ